MSFNNVSLEYLLVCRTTKIVTFCSSFNQLQPFSVISTAELCCDWLNDEEKALNPAKRKMKQIEVVKSMSGIGSLTY